MNRHSGRRLDFSDVALYAVTPDTTDFSFLLGQSEQLLQGGVDAIQLRCKNVSDRDLLDVSRKMKSLTAKYNALFIVNNRPDIAVLVDADGIHVGHEDLPVPAVREIVGHRKILGVSTHSVPEAIAAQKQGADYVSCGPLWATPTKPTYNPVGLGLIGLYRAALHVPFVAIGGINASNLDQVVATGAKTVAIVRALFEAENPTEFARQSKQKILANRTSVVSR